MLRSLNINTTCRTSPCLQPLSGITGFSDNNSSWVMRLEIANNPYIASTGPVAKLGAQQYESIEATQNVIYDAGTVQVVTPRNITL